MENCILDKIIGFHFLLNLGVNDKSKNILAFKKIHNTPLLLVCNPIL